MEEPDKAADIMCKANPELDPELVKASQEYLADEYQADATQWGLIDGDRWNAFYEWVNENKLVEGTIEKDAGYSNEYLPMVIDEP